MTKVILEGYFGLNEQDPYEPTGIFFKQSLDTCDVIGLNDILENNFGIEPNCNLVTGERKLKITIEEVDI